MLGDAPLGRWPIAYISNGLGDNLNGTFSLIFIPSGIIIGTSFLEASTTLTFTDTSTIIGFAPLLTASTALTFTESVNIIGLTFLEANTYLHINALFIVQENIEGTAEINFTHYYPLLLKQLPSTGILAPSNAATGSIFSSSSTSSISLYDSTTGEDNIIYEETF